MYNITLSHFVIFPTCDIITRIQQRTFCKKLAEMQVDPGAGMGVSLLLWKSLHWGYLCLCFLDPQSLSCCLFFFCWSHSQSSWCHHVLHVVSTQKIIVELNHYVALGNYGLKGTADKLKSHDLGNGKTY